MIAIVFKVDLERFSSAARGNRKDKQGGIRGQTLGRGAGKFSAIYAQEPPGHYVALSIAELDERRCPAIAHDALTIGTSQRIAPRPSQMRRG